MRGSGEGDLQEGETGGTDRPLLRRDGRHRPRPGRQNQRLPRHREGDFLGIYMDDLSSDLISDIRWPFRVGTICLVWPAILQTDIPLMDERGWQRRCF